MALTPAVRVPQPIDDLLGLWRRRCCSRSKMNGSAGNTSVQRCCRRWQRRWALLRPAPAPPICFAYEGSAGYVAGRRT